MAQVSDQRFKTQLEQKPGKTPNESDTKDDYANEKPTIRGQHTQQMAANMVNQTLHLKTGVPTQKKDEPQKPRKKKESQTTCGCSNAHANPKAQRELGSQANSDSFDQLGHPQASSSKQGSFQRVKTPSVQREFKDERRRRIRDDESMGIPLTRPEEEDCKRNSKISLGKRVEAIEEENRRVLAAEGVENPWACNNPTTLRLSPKREKGMREPQ